jgi:hypothetical protein
MNVTPIVAIDSSTHRHHCSRADTQRNITTINIDQSSCYSNIMFLSKKTALAVNCLLSVCITGTTGAFAPNHRVSVLSTRPDFSSIIRQSAEENDDDLNADNVEPPAAVDYIPRGGANINKPPPDLPTLATYRKFAVPCLCLWVAQPLLSLIDTAFVGRSGNMASSAAQLAALGVGCPFSTFLLLRENILLISPSILLLPKTSLRLPSSMDQSISSLS